MKKYLITLFCLLVWIDGTAQITSLSTLPGDTTLTVNTTGSNPIEVIFYPTPLCGSWGTPNKMIFSFIGDGNKWNIQTENIGYDTYLYLYEEVAPFTFTFLDCNDDYLSLASKVSWATQVGKVYHLVLGGFFGDSGITDLRFFPMEYCASKGTRNNFEWIKRVEIGGDIDNTSGKNTPAYADYTSHLAEVDTGEVVSVDLTPGYRRRVYREYWRIWVDWNNDGDFDDIDEKVFEKNGKNVQSGSFIAPVFADSNTLRMRVSMRWRRYPPSCGNFANGEVEDYSIKVIGGQGNIIEGPPQEEPEDDFNFAKQSEGEYSETGNGFEISEIFPNPIQKNNRVSGYIRVEKTGIRFIKVVNPLGQIVKTVAIDCPEEESFFEFSTEGLERGLYFLTINAHQESSKLIVQ